MLEITIVDKDNVLIASIQVGSKTDIPFVIGEIIEKNGYKVLIDEEPEEWGVKHGLWRGETT